MCSGDYTQARQQTPLLVHSFLQQLRRIFFFFFFWFSWDRVSWCNLGWPGTWYVDQASSNSQSSLHLPLHPEWWDSRCAPPSLVPDDRNLSCIPWTWSPRSECHRAGVSWAHRYDPLYPHEAILVIFISYPWLVLFVFVFLNAVWDFLESVPM